MTKRTDWQNYFFKFAELASERSTCTRRSVGAVLVKENMVIATGYNGPPRGVPHCDEVGGCTRDQQSIPSGQRHELCRGLHAEQNAICQAAKLGIVIDGATIYCRMTPCRVCAMLIINCGIKRVVCEMKYHDGNESEKMFKQADVLIDYIKDEILTYDKQ